MNIELKNKYIQLPFFFNLPNNKSQFKHYNNIEFNFGIARVDREIFSMTFHAPF